MASVYRNTPGTSKSVEGAGAGYVGTAQDAVPVLYPAVQPSKTLDTATGPATLFVSGDPGTFTLTGNDAGIIVHRELAGATGTYVLTGNAGVTRLTHGLAGATGVFTETGNAAGVIVRRQLSGGTGTFLETGNDGLFKLVLAGGVQYNLLGGTGAFVVVGNDGLFKLVARSDAPGGISGYLRPRKLRGVHMMPQGTMQEATRRAEEIMVGWRDDEEALLLIHIIETF